MYGLCNSISSELTIAGMEVRWDKVLSGAGLEEKSWGVGLWNRPKLGLSATWVVSTGVDLRADLEWGISLRAAPHLLIPVAPGPWLLLLLLFFLPSVGYNCSDCILFEACFIFMSLLSQFGLVVWALGQVSLRGGRACVPTSPTLGTPLRSLGGKTRKWQAQLRACWGALTTRVTRCSYLGQTDASAQVGSQGLPQCLPSRQAGGKRSNIGWLSGCLMLNLSLCCAKAPVAVLYKSCGLYCGVWCHSSLRWPAPLAKQGIPQFGFPLPTSGYQEIGGNGCQKGRSQN